MEISSPSFEDHDLYRFIHEVIEYEKARPLDGLSAADRLEAASERLAELASRISPVAEAGGDPGDDWSPREILAHIVLVSQVFGWATREVGEGNETAVDVLSFLRLRDLAGSGFAELPVEDLLEIVLSEHATTIEYLRCAGPTELARTASVYPFPMTPEMIALFHICGHVEMHIDQLERAIGRQWEMQVDQLEQAIELGPSDDSAAA